jgi:hypothetical protein
VKVNSSSISASQSASCMMSNSNTPLLHAALWTAANPQPKPCSISTWTMCSRWPQDHRACNTKMLCTAGTFTWLDAAAHPERGHGSKVGRARVLPAAANHANLARLPFVGIIWQCTAATAAAAAAAAGKAQYIELILQDASDTCNVAIGTTAIWVPVPLLGYLHVSAKHS